VVKVSLLPVRSSAPPSPGATQQHGRLLLPPTARRGGGAPALSLGALGFTVDEETPNGAVGFASRHRLSLLLNWRRGGSRGNVPKCPWHRRRAGQVARQGHRPERLGCPRAGQIRPSPFLLGRTQLRRRVPALGVRAGRGSGRTPSRALTWLDRRRAWGGGAARLTGARGQAEREERDKRGRADVWGPRGSEREVRAARRWLMGRKMPWVGPAASQGKLDTAHCTWLPLPNKIN
jgi:hypothetical protein